MSQATMSLKKTQDHATRAGPRGRHRDTDDRYSPSGLVEGRACSTGRAMVLTLF